MAKYTISIQAAEPKHLKSILQLQQNNLPKNLSEAEMLEQGFVSVEHDLAILSRMNEPHGHAIAIADEQVVGYALVMLPAFRDDIPMLTPMFDLIDKESFHKRPNTNNKYLAMGQICIDYGYRGRGLFQRLYDNIQDRLSAEYDLIFTEVASKNKRSLRAHLRQGFEIAHQYTGNDGISWELIVWDWRNAEYQNASLSVI